MQPNRKSLKWRVKITTYDISTLIQFISTIEKNYKHAWKIIYRVETGRYKASNAIQALSKIVFPIGATKNGTVKSTPFEK